MTPEILGAYRAARRADLEAARAVFHAPTARLRERAFVFHNAAHDIMVRARRRLVLSALGYLVTALVVVGVLYALLMLLWAGFGPVEPAPDFTPVQLPTL